MGLAYIHAWLTEDYWTIAQIAVALEASGATWQQVAESFSLAAASLLTDVCGGNSTHAAALAGAKAHADAARQARAAIARRGYPGSISIPASRSSAGAAPGSAVAAVSASAWRPACTW